MNNNILVVSHNLIGSNTNMGLTLEKIFKSVDPKNVGQIYFRNEKSKNKHYSLRMTDIDALGSFFIKKNKWSKAMTCQKNRNYTGQVRANEIKKNISTLAIRDFIWKHSNWKNQVLDEFIKTGEYSYLFVAPGYSKFIYDIAIYIHEKFEIPIISYFADNYYDGLDISDNCFSNKFQKNLNKKIEILINKSKKVVVISKTMKQHYDSVFKIDTITLYTPTVNKNVQKDVCPNLTNKNSIKILYAGNLSLGRLETLNSFLSLVNKINYNRHLEINIYSPLSKDENLKLNQRFSESIHSFKFHEFINHEQLLDVIKDSDILLHVESFDQIHIRRTKFSFSTKLSDFLSTNKAILVIGPPNIESVKYFKDNDLGYIIDKLDEINVKQTLDELISETKSTKYNNRFKVYKMNHSYDRVNELLKELNLLGDKKTT